MRFFLALWVAKTVKLIIKIFGKILKLKGSHYPGNIANKICPDFLSKIGKPETIITVTGTNGKTTTCNLIIDGLEKSGYKVLNNRFGSNVKGGITTSLLSGVNLFNKTKYNIAVLEIDERSSAKIYPYIKPTYAVVTNLFRDSIKRNAHSEYIFNIINNALPDESVLILNADDLISNRLKEGKNKKIFFGIEKQPKDTNEQVNIVNDVRICPNCYSKLKYDFIRYHHIGNAYCENCGYKSPKADYSVSKIDYDKNIIEVKYENDKDEFKMDVKLISDSIFNIYNQIVTIAVLKQLGIDDDKIKQSFENIEITKDRYKKENISGIDIINHLAKGYNPIACSIVFKYLKEENKDKEVILLIEDYHDNREEIENIAWFYDCDFEFLNDESIKKIIAMGIRAEDLKLRLLLAGVPENRIVAIPNEADVQDYLSYKKDRSIYILYDMYEQPIVDSVNKAIKDRILSLETNNNEDKNSGGEE